MAILGIQIVITMVMASVMSKIGPFHSFARWLLTSGGLVRYMHPSDEELRLMANVPKDKGKKGHRGRKNANDYSPENEMFNLPRSTDVQLETTKVTVQDIVQLRFYSEFQWLIDFALYAAVVYTFTEIYAHYFPAKAAEEVNLGMVWCILVAGFAYKILVSLTGLYFQGEESGERSLVIVMGFVYLFFAMLILIVHEDTLETGLDEAYTSFNASAAAFLAENAGLDSSGPASKLVLKFFIALWCASIGSLFTFPGLRIAKMQWDLLKSTEFEGPGITKVLLHAAFVSPLILTTLWVKPLSRDYLTERVYKGMSGPFLTPDQFETLRLYVVIFVVVFRLALMPKYLQTYLNIAYHRVEELKNEAGKISNVDMQKLVARVFYYLCVVTLQYVAPMILILYLSLMYKTMGGGSWTGLWTFNTDKEELKSFEFAPECGLNPEEGCGLTAEEIAVLKGGASGAEVGEDGKAMDEAIAAVTGQFSLAWQSLKQVFTPAVFRGLLGFSTWWCCLAWFVSSAIGITYQSYFSKI